MASLIPESSKTDFISALNDDIKIKDVRGDIRIKVEQDCRDYIKNNGKTEAVVVQGKNYNVITDDGTREFLGQKYFVFHLESTS